MISKHDEMKLWDEFIASLPAECYLKGYLAGAEEIIRRDMLDDMPSEPIAELNRQRDQAGAELAKVQAELARANKQFDEFKRHRARMEVEFRDLYKTLAELAEQASEAHASAARQCIQAKRNWPDLLK